jgi:acetyltransferase-like isoleucine patch superfamily enzyme
MAQTQILEHDWFSRPLPENVCLGKRSWLYSSFAFLHYQSTRPRGVSIGEDSGLYAGTFFDLGPDGEVEIGNYCTLVGAIICSNKHVTIGDYAFIAHEVVIADSWAAVPDFSIVRNQKNADGGGITIGSNAWIGAGAVLLSGARVGEGAIVAAQCVVDFEVPDFAMVAGNPAKIRGHAKG